MSRAVKALSTLLPRGPAWDEIRIELKSSVGIWFSELFQKARNISISVRHTPKSHYMDEIGAHLGQHMAKYEDCGAREELNQLIVPGAVTTRSWLRSGTCIGSPLGKWKRKEELITGIESTKHSHIRSIYAQS